MNPLDKDVLIVRRPETLRWIASRNPREVVWRTTLPISCMLLVLGIQSHRSIGAWCAGIAVGVLYWSLFEYVTHRWIYHRIFRWPKVRDIVESFHLYHHRNLDDRRVLNAGPLLTYPATAVLLTPILAISGSIGTTAAIGLGLVAAYSFYEWVHYSIHVHEHCTGYLAYLRRYHLYHHECRWNRNFGNTSPMWDWLAGTYDPGHRLFDSRSVLR